MFSYLLLYFINLNTFLLTGKNFWGSGLAFWNSPILPLIPLIRRLFSFLVFCKDWLFYSAAFAQPEYGPHPLLPLPNAPLHRW
jgi:hypothetical protein